MASSLKNSATDYYGRKARLESASGEQSQSIRHHMPKRRSSRDQ
jgi:hypothetical protein